MSAISRQPAWPVAGGRGSAHAICNAARSVTSRHRPTHHCPSPQTHPTYDLTHLAATSPSQLVIRRPFSFQPEQTPLHRGCAGWASPVGVSAR